MLAFGHKNSELIAAYRLMKSGVPVLWASEEFVSAGATYPAGTLLIPAAARVKADPLFTSLGVKATAITGKPKTLALKTPRVGLYQSYVPFDDEGWTRYVFDKQLGVDYTTLLDKDIRAGALRTKFDAIILPDSTPPRDHRWSAERLDAGGVHRGRRGRKASKHCALSRKRAARSSRSMRPRNSSLRTRRSRRRTP